MLGVAGKRRAPGRETFGKEQETQKGVTLSILFWNLQFINFF